MIGVTSEPKQVPDVAGHHDGHPREDREPEMMPTRRDDALDEATRLASWRGNAIAEASAPGFAIDRELDWSAVAKVPSDSGRATPFPVDRGATSGDGDVEEREVELG